MERFKTLLKQNIKGAFRAFPQLIFGAIALIILVSAIAFCGNEFLYGSLASATEGTAISLGVVMEDDSELAVTVKDAVLGMSEVNSSIDFQFVSRDEAMDRLSSGRLAAALIIPEDTAYNIIHGVNTPMTVVFPENSGMEAVIIKEIADSLSTMLSSAQAGIYSIYDFYNNHNAAAYKSDALRRMNLKYINLVATGDTMFDTNEVTATGSIPLMTYYIAGSLVLFALLFGTNCFSFIKTMPSVTSKVLTLNGTPLILQGLSSYLSILLAQTVVIFTTVPVVVLTMNMFNLTLSLSGIIRLIIVIPVFLLLSSSIMYFVSVLTVHNMGRIMITFFVSIGMCFLSGCFIPLVMLPGIIQIISRFMPAYYMISFGSSMLTGTFDVLSFFACLILCAIIFLLGVLVAHEKRRKELC